MTRWRVTALVVATALMPVVPGRSGANGSIRGRVDLPAAQSERRPSISELGAPARALSDRRRAVVYLDAEPQIVATNPRPQRASMDQRDEAFVPRVLAIGIGGTVDFPNNDRTYHNVFSLSRAKSFDLGRYAAGHSKAVRFNRPGVVRVFCDIHSHMSAFILVFAHRYFSMTNEAGTYAIEDVPPGTYTISVWSEMAPVESRTITVPPSGGAVEVHFAPGREAPER